MPDTFQPTVYLLASHKNGALYTGVTSNLVQRIWEHREAIRKGIIESRDIVDLNDIVATKPDQLFLGAASSALVR